MSKHTSFFDGTQPIWNHNIAEKANKRPAVNRKNFTRITFDPRKRQEKIKNNPVNKINQLMIYHHILLVVLVVILNYNHYCHEKYSTYEQENLRSAFRRVVHVMWLVH
ncbi:hypothetical protein DERF_011917 [Dermatophagoides farinae]|uniref:Uncharacterized protein n=1 Tax=Dermatophagoides farinae TaxID=6954 RepID=A0A922KXJ3_DERFA|nr:hypothetical protein DERF_011917 [Dermatophagoides farinae]